MAVSDFVLNVLGTSFSISVDEEPEYMERIHTQYRAAVENTKKMFSLKDPLVTAILTGFLLSDELAKLQKHEKTGFPEGEEQEAQELAMNMIARIDSVLEDKPLVEA
jgi:cell division protein ZapA